MDDVLQGLNQAQTAAVTSRADVLQVLAPPGSGKTKTLTARVGYLISHHGFEPRNIVVCTFTVKAAREMQERISAFLGKDKASRLVLGTFHSISRRYLAVYGTKIGLAKDFAIADTADTLGILKRIIKAAKLSIDAKAARARISSLKSQSISSEQFNLASKKADQQEVARVYTEYEDHLERSNLLDFDDLLLRCTELLRRYPSCVSDIEAVLIDEFQDTNNVQYELMSLFAQDNRRITVVGDPDQSIYGWRNAEIRNLKKMQDEYADTHVAKLEENYRSSGAILLSAQEVIEQDQSRPSKRLMPTHSVGMRPVLRRLETAAIEAMWIVSEIKRTSTLTGQLLGWSDYAILLRSAALSRHIESVLGKCGIPYRMVGGHKFFNRLEVKLVLDYLRVIHHPSNNDTVARVLNVPSRRIGDATIQKLLEHANERNLTLWAVVLGLAQGNMKLDHIASAQCQGLELFVNVVLTGQKKLRDAHSVGWSLSDFILYVIKKADLEDHLRKTKADDFDNRWANVQELLTQAEDAVADMPKALAGEHDLEELNELQIQEACNDGTVGEALEHFLASVALSAESQKQSDTDASIQQVTISTIHAAKGLEWPVVFVPSAYEGSIPHSRAEDHDEERRLLYVAMTRAQALLYISCPLHDSANKETQLSSFLQQQPMDSYFDKCGAEIGSTIAGEIATILRRPCPSKGVIDGALASIDHARDNQWPLLRSTDPEDMENNASGGFTASRDRYVRPQKNAGNYKQVRRVDGANTSLSGAQSFTIATTMASATFSTGFTTASKAMTVLAQQKTSDATSGISEATRIKTNTTSKRKLSQVESDPQKPRSLASFFAPKSSMGVPFDRRTAVDGQNILADVTNTHTSLLQAESLDETLANGLNVKPAGTMHATSLSQLSQAAPRKTLGLRRSLNGWSDRMAHKTKAVGRQPP